MLMALMATGEPATGAYTVIWLLHCGPFFIRFVSCVAPYEMFGNPHPGPSQHHVTGECCTIAVAEEVELQPGEQQLLPGKQQRQKTQ
jgi:hypothetical protein